jgi:diguanylate cyclase (GGDEF)-like protein
METTPNSFSDLKSVRDLQKLYTEIAKLITSSLEVSEIIDAIMLEVKNFFQPQNWSLLRLDITSNKLFFIVADGIDQEVVRHIHLDVGEGIAGYVAETAKSKIVHNVDNDSSFSPLIDKLTGFKTVSVIAVPIVFQNQVLGVIELINTVDARSFTDDDLIILETIADFSAIALTNAMRYEYMSSLAISDPLTGLYNRARLNKLLSTSSHPGTRMGKEGADSRIIVVCVDVNNMKYVNDNFGHRAGDEVLVKTANHIQACCLHKDLAFRTGGDEFLLLIINYDKHSEEAKLSHLRKQLEDCSKPAMRNQGFSFGMVAGCVRDLEQLLADADADMYKNKQMNKNISSR